MRKELLFLLIVFLLLSAVTVAVGKPDFVEIPGVDDTYIMKDDIKIFDQYEFSGTHDAYLEFEVGALDLLEGLSRSDRKKIERCEKEAIFDFVSTVLIGLGSGTLPIDAGITVKVYFNRGRKSGEFRVVSVFPNRKLTPSNFSDPSPKQQIARDVEDSLRQDFWLISKDGDPIFEIAQYRGITKDSVMSEIYRADADNFLLKIEQVYGISVDSLQSIILRSDTLNPIERMAEIQGISVDSLITSLGYSREFMLVQFTAAPDSNSLSDFVTEDYDLGMLIGLNKHLNLKKILPGYWAIVPKPVKK